MRLEKEAALTSKVGLMQLAATVIIYSALVLLGQKGLLFLGSWQFDFAAFVPLACQELWAAP